MWHTNTQPALMQCTVVYALKCTASLKILHPEQWFKLWPHKV